MKMTFESDVVLREKVMLPFSLLQVGPTHLRIALTAPFARYAKPPGPSSVCTPLNDSVSVATPPFSCRHVRGGAVLAGVEPVGAS